MANDEVQPVIGSETQVRHQQVRCLVSEEHQRVVEARGEGHIVALATKTVHPRLRICRRDDDDAVGSRHALDGQNGKFQTTRRVLE